MIVCFLGCYATVKAHNARTTHDNGRRAGGHEVVACGDRHEVVACGDRHEVVAAELSPVAEE
jgi:hypothetical protein